MSYQTERQAIEAYIAANWVATPIGYDRQEFTPVAPSIRLTIQSGEAFQRSFAKPGSNRVEHVGVLQINIFVDGGEGSQEFRGYVETLQGLLKNKKLASDGTDPATSSDVFVVFSTRGQIPYLASVQDMPPFTMATLNAPFSRYEHNA